MAHVQDGDDATLVFCGDFLHDFYTVIGRSVIDYYNLVFQEVVGQRFV